MLVVSFFSCSREATIKEEQQILIVEDLSVLFSKENLSTSSKGGCALGLEEVKAFPINGCGSFTIKQTFNYVFGSTTIDTKITVCCVCAVCSPMRFRAKNSPILISNESVESITVEESSSIVYENYIISIAEGDYEVNKNGEIKTMKYKVIVN